MQISKAVVKTFHHFLPLYCPITEGFLSSALPLLANISYRKGRQLKFDANSEKFVSDKEADALLTRNYRKPYIVPDQV